MPRKAEGPFTHPHPPHPTLHYSVRGQAAPPVVSVVVAARAVKGRRLIETHPGQAP